MPIMLWIAAIIEGVIQNFADMGILLGIQFINAAISFYETSKAGNAVAALKASLKPTATVKRDGAPRPARASERAALPSPHTPHGRAPAVRIPATESSGCGAASPLQSVAETRKA